MADGPRPAARGMAPRPLARRPTVDSHHTSISFSRDLVFDDPASVDAFAALFEQEIAALQAYFADRGH